jgi:lipoprotein NlpD
VSLARAIGVIGIIGGMCGCASQSYSPVTYVVRAQDTLYGIAWRHDLDYRDLARWNNIGPDYRITVGEILTLRAPARSAGGSKEVSAAAARPGDTRASQAPHPPPTRAPASPSASAPASPMPPAAASEQGLRWVWPTAHPAPPRPVPGGGILFLGELGQPIHAACSGHVVYVGNGLRSYGNLIIIKHGESLLSAYAHTRELAVHEGEDVVAGQPIAQMGEGPHQIAALYFEIRLNGRPVDPLPYLAADK